ncbi:hypothetical protein IEQ34_006086 [Dendrobium chrysotoxum]|uniref:Uncharacterized protein n=1 Tax=Dendrobium chrysotoxum TaxID=161865 RepID=A0AAV7HEH3_DENCH|nr:hypothetical protein IEQ34_006086 [Dendrobium chrysotoxum]
MKVPARSDHAYFPPPGYVTVYEFSLRAGLRFPPSELIDILTICGVCLSQFSYRVISIVMGLIVLFRDRGVVLSSKCLSRMWRLFSDAQGHISFRSKWLDIRTRDPLKEDLLRILKLPDLDALHYEVCYLSRYIDEKYFFKVGLSTQAGRSHAQILKKSVRVSEVVPQKSHSKRPGSEEGLQAPRKKKADEVLTVVSKVPQVSPSKSYIPEDVLNHQCIGHRRAEELGEYKKKYDSKVKEMKVVVDPDFPKCLGQGVDLTFSFFSLLEMAEYLGDVDLEVTLPSRTFLKLPKPQEEQSMQLAWSHRVIPSHYFSITLKLTFTFLSQALDLSKNFSLSNPLLFPPSLSQQKDRSTTC